ncbi:MAG: phage tail tape measure protein [Prevotellaceae bacterium]|jgi:TP901 family phage tail tape measure protein|nr:phage tail tape measure protein [Prevotellaceae bacterium]
MAGFNIEGINQAIRPISDIALVGDTDLGATADVVTNIMTGYGIAPENLRHAADIMTMTFTKTNSTLMEIAEAFKYSSSLLSAAGISFEEATAGLGILGDAGIKGSQAGTTMRTLVGNMVNPTKIQRRQWEKLGVERFDGEGNLRPLANIFRDLAESGLDIDTSYKMFHRTAAQGAVSLAKNVEKWDEVIMQNFMSDGLVHRLAEEKKNTIQGLWDQLTSAFVEDGMLAFEDMQAPIKSMLKAGTAWLESPETVRKIKSFSRDLWEVGNWLKDVTGVIIDLYGRFDGIIKLWAKFQIGMWPFLAGVRALRSVVSLYSLGDKKIEDGKSVLKIVSPLLFKKGEGASGGAVATVATTAADAANTVAETAEAAVKKTAEGVNKVLNSRKEAWKNLFASIPTNYWIMGAATAVGALGVAFHNTYKYFDDFKKAHGQWYEKVYETKGYLTEGLSPTERYLKLVHDKQLSVNEKVAEYNRLRKIEMGLTSEALASMEGKTVGDVYSEETEAHPWFSFFTPNKETKALWESAHDKLLSFSKEVAKQYELKSYTSHQGVRSFYITKNGERYSNDDFRRDMASYGMGKDHLFVKETTEEYINLFRQHPEQWEDIRKKLYGLLGEHRSNVKDEYNFLSLEQIADLPFSELIKVPRVYRMAQTAILKNFDFDNVISDNPVTKSLLAFKEIYNTPGNLSPKQQADFLYDSGVARMRGKNGAAAFSNAWYSEIGFNLQTKQWDDMKKAEEFYKTTFVHAREILAQSPKEFAKLFSIFDFAIFVDAKKKATLNFKEPKLGEERWVDTTHQIWELDEKTGQKKWRLSDRVTPNPDGTFDDWGWGTGGKGDNSNNDGSNNNNNNNNNQSDYESNYKSGSAAPKQIIVKIENLMNVKSIDLSNPDNVAVIENIKAQLSQALVDVVHDFDATFHG